MLKTASSITNAIGALNYKGTWDASTNNPTLTSGVGVKGDYYVVSVAGSTNLDGTTLWGVGDWAVFNGSTWQKVDGGSTTNVTSLTVTGLTGYMYANNTSPVTASTTIPNAGLANSTATLGNATITLGSTTSTVGNLTLQNANVASVAVTFPNSYLANSTATLGNSTVTLGSTTSTVGNLTLQNVTISSGNSTVTNENASYVNVSTAIRTQALTGYLYGNANTGNVSAATTIPNTGLANSSATLGNTAVTLGSTTTSVGNLTLTGASVTGTISMTNTTNANATFATSSLQLVPEGYVIVSINGVNKKIPYYAV